jgi:replicative DNA helicase
MFVDDDSGAEVRAVFRFAADHYRRYGVCPSGPYLKHHFPNWRGEQTPDPVEALLDEFLAEYRRRYFESKVYELSMLPKTSSYWENRFHLDEVLMEAAREVAACITSGRVARFSADFESRIEQYEEERGRYRPGIPLGVGPIDSAMGGGAKRGWLVTYAGFSGLGKSFFSLRSLLSAFEDDKTALMLNAEMSTDEMIERLDTMVMRWPHFDYMSRALSDAQIQKWRDVARVYGKAKGEIIALDRLGGASVDRIHAEIERYNPDIACIDYVQRLSSSSKRPKWEQLEEMTNELKTIAMDTDTAIIMVSQDGRDAAEQGSTRTNMGGSISVYQAADAYLGMMQDDGMAAEGKMRIKLLKFRHGPRVETDVIWDPAVGDFCRPFTDRDQFVRQG